MIEAREWDSIILVAGMRRAGNHAVIGWLANAYESSLTPIDYEWVGVGFSESGKTIHLNDIPLGEENKRRKRNILRSQREILLANENPRRLILSTEDVTRREVDDSSLFAGRVDARVHVSRSVLNLLASRLALLAKNPIGANASLLPMDQAFLDRVAEDMRVTSDGWVAIDFDQWTSGEPSYRSAVLERLDLSMDIAPPMTKHGGGSSFTGNDAPPETMDLHSRWKLVEWPDDLLDLLDLKRNRGLLTEIELDHLSDLRRSS